MKDNLADEQEIKDTPAKAQEMKGNLSRLNPHYQCIRAKLETLSAEQLGMYLHEVKWLLNQLGKVIPDPKSPNLEMSKQSEIIEAQVVLMQEALILDSLSLFSLLWPSLLVSRSTMIPSLSVFGSHNLLSLLSNLLSR